MPTGAHNHESPRHRRLATTGATGNVPVGELAELARNRPPATETQSPAAPAPVQPTVEAAPVAMLAAIEEDFGPMFADPMRPSGEVVAVSSFENGLCEVKYPGRIASISGETLRVYRQSAYLGTLRVLQWRNDRLVGLSMEEAPRLGDVVETPDGEDRPEVKLHR